jgi:hypothetical protein
LLKGAGAAFVARSARGQDIGISPPIQAVPIAAMLLDLVISQSIADAAYGMLKLRSLYTGYCCQLRNKQSGSYVTLNIGFVQSGYLFVANVAQMQAFNALKDGGSITEGRFYDQTGNGNDTTFTAGGPGFYFFLDPVTSFPVLSSTQSATGVGTNSQALTLPSGVALNNDAYSTVFLGNINSSTFTQATQIYELESPRTRWVAFASNGGVDITFGTDNSNAAFGVQKAGPSVMIGVVAAATAKFIVDSDTASVSKTTQNATSTGGYLGWSINGSTVGGGFDCMAFVFYNRTLSGAEIASCQSWGYTTGQAQATGSSRIIVVGESITEGIETTSNYIWTTMMQPLLNKHWDVYVDATGGYGYQDHINNLSRTTAKIKAGCDNVIAIFGCCWNDIVHNSLTPAQAYANLQTLIADYRSYATGIGASLKVVGTGQSCAVAPTLANQNTFWGLLNANNSFFDQFWNLWTDPNIGSASALASPYYYSDQTHLTSGLTNSGHAIVTAGMAPLINAAG